MICIGGLGVVGSNSGSGKQRSGRHKSRAAASGGFKAGFYGAGAILPDSSDIFELPMSSAIDVGAVQSLLSIDCRLGEFVPEESKAFLSARFLLFGIIRLGLASGHI